MSFHLALTSIKNDCNCYQNLYIISKFIPYTWYLPIKTNGKNIIAFDAYQNKVCIMYSINDKQESKKKYNVWKDKFVDSKTQCSSSS